VDRNRILIAATRVRKTDRKTGSGFSLIELVVVVAIVGILTSLAYPSYQQQVEKARRVDALNLLTTCATQQERAFSVNNSYVLSAGEAPLCGIPDGSSRSSDHRYYTVEVVSPNEDGCREGSANDGDSSALTKYSCFTAVVTAVKGRAQFADTQCAKFEITHLGARLARNSEGEITTAVCFRD
jgi:type IV pilus assembly protein PilE